MQSIENLKKQIEIEKKQFKKTLSAKKYFEDILFLTFFSFLVGVFFWIFRENTLNLARYIYNDIPININFLLKVMTFTIIFTLYMLSELLFPIELTILSIVCKNKKVYHTVISVNLVAILLCLNFLANPFFKFLFSFLMYQLIVSIVCWQILLKINYKRKTKMEKIIFFIKSLITVTATIVAYFFIKTKIPLIETTQDPDLQILVKLFPTFFLFSMIVLDSVLIFIFAKEYNSCEKK